MYIQFDFLFSRNKAWSWRSMCCRYKHTGSIFVLAESNSRTYSNLGLGARSCNQDAAKKLDLDRSLVVAKSRPMPRPADEKALPEAPSGCPAGDICRGPVFTRFCFTIHSAKKCTLLVRTMFQTQC